MAAGASATIERPAEGGGVRRPKRVLTVFGLVMITTGTITSIQSAPSLAEWGFALVCIYLVVAAVFLIPSALISAELATGWPADGGVYVWVREAFGTKWGFMAVWQQFAENAIWFPSILQVIAITAAYAWDKDLSDNTWFVFVGVNVLFWVLTLLNLLGMRTSSIVATIGTIGGRVLPIAVIAVLAAVYLARGDKSHIGFTFDDFVPDVTDWGKVAFIVGAFLTFAGIEASSSNAGSARNPRRDYPRAIIISAGISFLLVTIVGLAIAIVIPTDQLSLVAGSMQTIETLLDTFNISYLLAPLALIIAVGMVGEVNNWIVGPTRGLLVASREGSLPRWTQHVNNRAVHSRILIFQACFVTIMSLLTLGFGVQSAFWIMTAVPTQIYLVMYIMMFAAAVRLRYSQPHVKRSYRVPLGNGGMWTLAVVGIVAATIAIPVGFIPPSTVPDDQELIFVVVAMTVSIAMLFTPLVIFRIRRPEWKTASEEDAIVDDGDADDEVALSP